MTTPPKRAHALNPLARHLAACGLMALALPALAQSAASEAPAAASAASAPQPEVAAPAKADRNQLQQVVVTAQKRSQRLKEVPVAISVVSADQMEKQGLRDITDLAKSAASLEFGDTKTGGAGGSASIRGIGTAVFTTSAESSVGLVVDGVPLGNTAGGALFDMERVEVLRGPQGTLFGKNASAGVLNMVTKAPRLNRFEGFASVELAGQDSLGSKLGNTSLRGGVNVPINEQSALRATAHVDRLTGVYHNTLTGEDSATKGMGARLRYLLKPDADLSIHLIAEHDDSKTTGPAFFAPALASSSAKAGFADCGVTVSVRNNEVCSDASDRARVVVDGLSAQIDKTLDNSLSLTSITAVRNRKTGPDQNVIDMSAGWDKVRTSGGEIRARQFTQELRLATPGKQEVDWVGGLFFSDYHATKTNTTAIYPSPTAVSHGAPQSITTLADSTTDLRSAAAFGQATFRLNEQTSLLAGLRYTRDTVYDKQTQTANVVFPAFALPTSVHASDGRATQTNLSGKVGVQHQWSRDTGLYATLSRGYKGPQIDNDTAIDNDETSGRLVKAEVPTSLEVGLKTSLLDRRVDVDLALFNTRIRNFQEQSCTLTSVGALSCVPLNVASVTSRGLEFDLRARVASGLSLSASGAMILGTEYPKGFMYDGQDVGGQRLMYSPKTKLTLGLDYSTSIWGDYEWSLGGDVTYKSKVRYCNTLAAGCAYDAHSTAGVRTGVRSPDDRWGLGLFVRNLTDERVPNAILYPLPGRGADSGYAYSLGANSFRMVGLQADIKF